MYQTAMLQQPLDTAKLAAMTPKQRQKAIRYWTKKAGTAGGSSKSGASATGLSKQQRTTEIRDWLCAILGNGDANPSAMKIYADYFVEEGFDSIDTISRFCTQQDVEGFTWMKDFHKRSLVTRAMLVTE